MDPETAVSTRWASDTLYLVHNADGFVTGSFTTQLAKDERLLVRATGGLLEASFMAKYRYSFRTYTDEYWGFNQDNVIHTSTSRATTNINRPRQYQSSECTLSG